jgi:hypothetical protein
VLSSAHALVSTGAAASSSLARSGENGLETEVRARRAEPHQALVKVGVRDAQRLAQAAPNSLLPIATTGTTVAVAAFIASVYLAGLIADATRSGRLPGRVRFAANHFEMLCYIVVAIFATSWLAATAIWRYRGLAQKYGDLRH